MATVTHQSYLTSPSLKKPHHLSSYQNLSLSFPQHPSSCSLRSSFLHSDGTRASFSISSTKKGKGNATNTNTNEDATKKKRSSASVEQKFTYEGSITESLPNGMFYVRLDNEDVILGYISGKIRRNFVRVLPGDRVTVEVSRYDSTRGRIIYRLRNKKDGTD